MKVLVVVSCLLAVASAGYHGVHIPVLDHNGYQLDEPAVAIAKAAHFAAHADANARNGYGVYAGHVAVAAPLAYAGHYAHHLPAFDHNGYQLDTPEVAHAKAAHFAAHADVSARNYAHGYPLVHYRKRRGLLAAPLAYTHGFYGAQHLPVIGANGVPLDTPEVAHAKVAHAAAHVDAAARNGDLHIAAPVAHVAHTVAAAPVALAAPVAYAHSYGHYHGPQHLPVIGPHGVPLDTPDVVASRAAHAVHHVEAKARNGDFAVVAPFAYAAHGVVAAHHGVVAAPILAHAAPVAINGVPLDTPEVAHAKVAHAAAHVEALARNVHHY